MAGYWPSKFFFLHFYELRRSHGKEYLGKKMTPNRLIQLISGGQLNSRNWGKHQEKMP